MNFIRAILVGALLTVAAAHAAFAGDKEYLESVYNRMAAAIANKDVEGYMAFVDPGAVSIDVKGNKKDAQAMRAEFNKLIPMIRNFRAVVALDNVHNTGTVVTAVAKTATFFEVQAGANDWKPFIVIDASDDVWELKGGAWKMTSTKTLHSEGKPLPPEIAQQLKGNGGTPQVTQGNPVPPVQQQPSVETQQQANNFRQSQQIMYDQCMRQCAYMSLNCSMSSGNYFGGNSYYTGTPCLTSQGGCQLGCKPPSR
jgi:ketosteroid isomerase-like protein